MNLIRRWCTLWSVTGLIEAVLGAAELKWSPALPWASWGSRGQCSYIGAGFGFADVSLVRLITLKIYLLSIKDVSISI